MHLISALFLSTPSLHLPLHIFSLYLLSSLSSAFPFFTSSVNITSPILHLSISLFPPYLEANETKCPKCSSHLKNPWVWPSEKSLKKFLLPWKSVFVSQPIKAGWFNIQNTSVSHCTYICTLSLQTFSAYLSVPPNLTLSLVLSLCASFYTSLLYTPSLYPFSSPLLSCSDMHLL